MSWAHINAARDVDGLDPRARHVLLVYATYADGDGRAWPSAGTVSACVGCSPVSVRRALDRIACVPGVIVTKRAGTSAVVDLANLALLMGEVPRALGISTSRIGNDTSRIGNDDRAQPMRDEYMNTQLEQARTPAAARPANPVLAARLEAFQVRRTDLDTQLTLEV